MGRSIAARALILGTLLAVPGQVRALPLYPALDPAWLPHLPTCTRSDRTCDIVSRRRVPVCTWRLRPTPDGLRRVRICG
ncbi:hypothetical protein [Methylobacterium platani]|uniref:Uncharacterized protein n=2 Tax=Methylobacterium platani TaxID=427683 RepID=A0A179S1U5_9HYPH|nr:hypothetical protein [Methylobacterium platani]KMO17979.1 hypothetical protein SQ03_10975 [Methylobacterium platani JCM 14648]OAS18963.1 hypothetical protein A5481_25520 [Methylobacterium platani]